MRSLVLLSCVALALAACEPSDGNGDGGSGGDGGTGGAGGTAGAGGDGGGTGGVGGSGGTGGSTGDAEAHCRRACNAIGACMSEEMGGETIPPEQLEACVENCLETFPADRAATCADCFEQVACDLLEPVCMDTPLCEQPLFDLDVVGEGFDAMNGKSVHATVLVGDEFEMWAEYGASATIEGGAFHLRLPEVLRAEDARLLEIAVDANEDGACGPEDLVFRQALEPATGPQAVRVSPPAASDEEPCAWSEETPPRIFVEGSGFAAAEGRWVVLAHVDGYEGGESRELATARIENGGFRASFGYAWSGAQGRIAWVIDDGDWLCEDGEDTGGTVLVGSHETGDRTIAITPADTSPGFCGELRYLGHDVTFRTSGWPHPQYTLVEAMLLDADGFEVEWEDVGVESGAFEVRFPRVALEGEAYRIALWVDTDDDYACEAPPDDAFLIEVPAVSGAVVIERAWGDLTADAAACDHFGWTGEE